MPQDQSEAVKYLHLASERQDRDAITLLGLSYLKGIGLERDTTIGFRMLELAAKAGGDDAKYYLGVIYIDNLMEHNDAETGLNYLREAADAGHAFAAVRLGQELQDGLHIEKNQDKAFQLFLSAASQSNPEAMFELGTCYLQGRGTDQDNAKGAEWVRLAAEAGHAKAMYLNALLIAQNGELNIALSWLSKAAAAGEVGLVYEFGIDLLEEALQQKANAEENVDQELDFAHHVVLIAAESGSHDAMVKLAEHYAKSNLSPFDPDKDAAYWTLQAERTKP